MKRKVGINHCDIFPNEDVSSGLPEDCVVSDDPRQHEVSLFLMRHRFDIVSSDDILASWQAWQDGEKGSIL